MKETTQKNVGLLAWTVVAAMAGGLLLIMAENEGWLAPNPNAGAQAELEARCLNRIEGMATHRFKWTAKTNWGRFNIRREDYEPRKVRYLEGDELELMNGYGAWFKYQYMCRLADDGDPAPQLWKVKG